MDNNRKDFYKRVYGNSLKVSRGIKITRSVDSVKEKKIVSRNSTSKNSISRNSTSKSRNYRAKNTKQKSSFGLQIIFIGALIFLVASFNNRLENPIKFIEQTKVLLKEKFNLEKNFNLEEKVEDVFSKMSIKPNIVKGNGKEVYIEDEILEQMEEEIKYTEKK